jgi:hypothetical protein
VCHRILWPLPLKVGDEGREALQRFRIKAQRLDFA